MGSRFGGTGDGDVAGEWTSVAVIEHGRPRPVVVGTTISLWLDENTLSASLGCNRMVARYRLVDHTLAIDGRVSTTRKRCSRERHDQDAWFADLLAAGPVLERRGDALWLVTDVTAIEFAAAPTPTS